MGRLRRCDDRCHLATGTRCECWCGGAFHGSKGSGNRALLRMGTTKTLEEHGFKKGETVYMEQLELLAVQRDEKE